MIDWIHRARTKPPPPFLEWPFEKGVEVRTLSGFQYTQQESDIHGEKLEHNGVDLEVPRCTPVLAPCSGFALATYGECKTKRRLNLDTALWLNPRERNIRPEDSHTDLPLWSGPGLIIQIVRPDGTFVQLTHFNELGRQIPYFQPVVQTDDLLPSPALRLPMRKYRKAAVWVNAGEFIGYSGMTGCGWGEASCFSYQREVDPPVFTDTPYTYWSNPHLHLAVLSKRAWLTRNAIAFCPYGIGGTVEQYPHDAILRFGKRSLWKKK